MRPGRAFALAQRCFEVARTTSFAGEREAAIARGTAIAAAAGLSLDLFDVPGRIPSHAARPAADASDAFAGYRTMSAEELIAAMREHRARMAETYGEDVAASLDVFYRTLDRRCGEVGAAGHETVYDARRRNFDRATAAARARDAARDAARSLR